jgi:hypothetical protein
MKAQGVGPAARSAVRHPAGLVTRGGYMTLANGWHSGRPLAKAYNRVAATASAPSRNGSIA